MIKQPLCSTCGTQFPPGEPLPELCPICNDDRQYVNLNGQSWTELVAVNKNYGLKVNRLHDNLYDLTMAPGFGIGQRAFLIITPEGNILWDCIPLISEAVIEFIKGKGGLTAIAFSHPHYYSTMNEWAAIFNCPVFIHKNDGEYIVYKGDHIRLWEGNNKTLPGGVTIHHTGGHFAGSCVLHVPSVSPKGALLVGDTMQIALSKRHIAVMYSYPNHIMLPKNEFLSFHKKTVGLDFDLMYGAFAWQNLTENAKVIFDMSMQRYLESYGI